MEIWTDELRNELWEAYRSKDRFGRIDYSDFIETVLSIKPELSYDTCCRMASEMVGGHCEDIPFSPDAFIFLCREYISALNPTKVLIPIADGSETSIFVDNLDIDYVFTNKKNEGLAKKYLSINSIDSIPANKQYDLILADLPLGPINSSFIAGRTIEKCIDNLSDNGYAIYTFARGATCGTGRNWLNKLSDKGLYCNAIMDMPINSYCNIAKVDTVIGVFSKNKTDKLFVAFLSDESITKQAVKNFLDGTASKSNPKMGVYVDDDLFCYDDYNTLNRINTKSKSLSKAYNGELEKISKLGKVHVPNKNKEFEENGAVVYIPKLGNSPVVLSPDEFHIKPQNYFQIAIDEEKIIPRFLAYFFNTEEGINLRQLYSKGGTIKALNAKIIGDMMVPCPPISVQSEYMATYERLEVLRMEVESLKSKFQKTPASFKNILTEMKDINNHGDRFAQWIESLPYPIATILKRYSVADDYSKRQEILFFFFEAFSIFESTILSAALDKKMVDCTSLNNVEASFFEHATFGNWVMMDRALSNLYSGLLNSNDDISKRIPLACFHTEDENVVRLLCNKKVCNALDQANGYRNTWKGHGGITSETIYKEHVDTLDSLMRSIQDSIKDLYERIRLVRPVSLDYTDGQFDIKIEVLMGSNPIFNKDTVKSVNPMDKAKLYLQIIDTGEFLELPPYFILKNSPAEAKNACYFYNRVESGNSRYVSYHFDGRPEDTESGQIVFQIIKNILSN